LADTTTNFNGAALDTNARDAVVDIIVNSTEQKFLAPSLAIVVQLGKHRTLTRP
jgi:hypothetical protein